MSYQAPKGLIPGTYDDAQLSSIVNTQGFTNFVQANPQEANVGYGQAVADYENNIAPFYAGYIPIAGIHVPKMALIGAIAVAAVILLK